MQLKKEKYHEIIIQNSEIKILSPPLKKNTNYTMSTNYLSNENISRIAKFSTATRKSLYLDPVANPLYPERLSWKLAHVAE